MAQSLRKEDVSSLPGLRFKWPIPEGVGSFNVYVKNTHKRPGETVLDIRGYMVQPGQGELEVSAFDLPRKAEMKAGKHNLCILAKNGTYEDIYIPIEISEKEAAELNQKPIEGSSPVIEEELEPRQQAIREVSITLTTTETTESTVTLPLTQEKTSTPKGFFDKAKSLATEALKKVSSMKKTKSEATNEPKKQVSPAANVSSGAKHQSEAAMPPIVHPAKDIKGDGDRFSFTAEPPIDAYEVIVLDQNGKQLYRSDYAVVTGTTGPLKGQETIRGKFKAKGAQKSWAPDAEIEPGQKLRLQVLTISKDGASKPVEAKEPLVFSAETIKSLHIGKTATPAKAAAVEPKQSTAAQPATAAKPKTVGKKPVDPMDDVLERITQLKLASQESVNKLGQAVAGSTELLSGKTDKVLTEVASSRDEVIKKVDSATQGVKDMIAAAVWDKPGQKAAAAPQRYENHSWNSNVGGVLTVLLIIAFIVGLISVPAYYFHANQHLPYNTNGNAGAEKPAASAAPEVKERVIEREIIRESDPSNWKRKEDKLTEDTARIPERSAFIPEGGDEEPVAVTAYEDVLVPLEVVQAQGGQLVTYEEPNCDPSYYGVDYSGSSYSIRAGFRVSIGSGGGGGSGHYGRGYRGPSYRPHYQPPQHWRQPRYTDAANRYNRRAGDTGGRDTVGYQFPSWSRGMSTTQHKPANSFNSRYRH